MYAFLRQQAYAAVVENLLNCEFVPKTLNQAWISGITYIRTRSRWGYRAVCSRRVIGWVMEPHRPAERVCQAFKSEDGVKLA